MNVQNAGGTVPIKFALGGNQGLKVLAAASPRSQQVACGSTAAATGGTRLPGSLTYNAAEARYQFDWKTEKAWAGTCRQLIVELIDGSYHRASFRFK